MKIVKLVFPVLLILSLVSISCKDSSGGGMSQEEQDALSLLENMPDLGFDLPGSLGGSVSSPGSRSTVLQGTIADGEVVTASDFPSAKSMSADNLRGQVEMANFFAGMINEMADLIADDEISIGETYSLGYDVSVHVLSATAEKIEVAVQSPSSGIADSWDYNYFIVSLDSSGKYVIETFMDINMMTYVSDGTQSIARNNVYLYLVEGSEVSCAFKETEGTYPLTMAVKTEFSSDASVTMYMAFDSNEPDTYYADKTVGWGDNNKGGMEFNVSALSVFTRDYYNSTGDLILEETDAGLHFLLKYLLPLSSPYAGMDIIADIITEIDDFEGPLDNYYFNVDENDNGVVDDGDDSLENVSTETYFSFDTGSEGFIKTRLPVVSTPLPAYYNFAYTAEVAAVDAKLDALMSSYSFSVSDYSSKLTGVSEDIKSLF